MDYLKEFGFEKSPIDISTIVKKGGNKSLSTSHKEVSIRSCELWEGTYRLKVSKDVDNIDVCIYHLAGVPSIHHFERLTQVQEMPISLMQDAISLVLQRDGVNISNRIYILDQERIQKGCPDKVIKQLADLFGKSEGTNWWNKIDIFGNTATNGSLTVLCTQNTYNALNDGHSSDYGLAGNNHITLQVVE